RRAPDRRDLLHSPVLQVPPDVPDAPGGPYPRLQEIRREEPRGRGSRAGDREGRGPCLFAPRRGGRMSAVMPILQPADYKSDLKPVWCAGCGDFGALAALHRAMAKLQLQPENTVVVSGIGCSSRLPGYVSTFGFNGVHGRALTLATGIKASRPELSVIAVGGDGDGVAIGGTHLLHRARRSLA